MTPDTEAALADVIKSAAAPMHIQGGATRGFVVPGTPLSTRYITGISLYEPGALTLVAAAGTTVRDIDQALAAENQRLAFEPTDYRKLLGTTGEPTIGGVLATNASGPRRIQGGAARDYALGVRFVDGNGAIVKNGGRVMKNVTGYDLVKLFSGSFGTLGVLTEVSLKVMPVPETQSTLMLHGLSDVAAVRAMADAMRSPFEVTGAAHGAYVEGEAAVTLLRLEGFEGSVAYRINALKDLLTGTGAQITVIDAAASAQVWRDIRDVTVMAKATGDVWRVSCKPSQAAELAQRADALSCAFDWSGGLIWVNTPPDTDLRARLGVFDGHATLVRASEETRRRLPVFHPQSAGIERLCAGLRARFDPRGILNKGLMDAPETEVA
ncbi:FAD-binding protein [Roseobacter denitrificans]|nr:FAD-binding protein [Roseobacter denitrificans]AVL54936.1 FAD-binding protein [Roseobacter denitrificans]